VAGAVLLAAARRGVTEGSWSHALQAALPVIAILQVGLGIATLVGRVPVPMAALHQAGAVLLLTVTVLIVHDDARR
jgi:cytochrome c oxidase assembly protein subunit 15